MRNKHTTQSFPIPGDVVCSFKLYMWKRAWKVSQLERRKQRACRLKNYNQTKTQTNKGLTTAHLPYPAMSLLSCRYVLHLLMTTVLKLSKEVPFLRVSPKIRARTITNTSTATPIRIKHFLRFLLEPSSTFLLAIFTLSDGTEVDKSRRCRTAPEPAVSALSPSQVAPCSLQTPPSMQRVCQLICQLVATSESRRYYIFPTSQFLEKLFFFLSFKQRAHTSCTAINPSVSERWPAHLLLYLGNETALLTHFPVLLLKCKAIM